MPHNVHPKPFMIQPPAELTRQMPQLLRYSQGLSRKYVDGLVVKEEELQALGSYLWDALKLQDEFDAAFSTAGNAILPVVIESDSAEVQVLPWEILHHPVHGFLGRNPAFTLTRRIHTRPAEAALQKGPLRVLLFTSLPDDVHPERGRLDVEAEQAQVQDALLPWISKGLVQLEMPDDGRFVTLKDRLKEFDPHVLFLSGHGKFHHTPHTGESYGVFLFENEAGDGDAVREEDIAQAFVGSNVQVVIVSACESGKTASDALNNGLTARLSRQGIPHVVGMRESVLDKAGILFACTLCDAIAHRERMDVALQAARAAILQPFSGEDASRLEAGGAATQEQTFGQWCLPMLVSTSPHRPLIDWDFEPREVDTERQKQALGTISLPERFIGRRSDLRRHKSALLKGRLQKLLITGPGGQGKTSLAGKLALDLRKQGWQVFAWSAQTGNPWLDFEFDLQWNLLGELANQYDRRKPALLNDPFKRAETLLALLLKQFHGRVVFFLDNLESLQDESSLVVRDENLAAWLEAAQKMEGLLLLVTSRWVPPGWGGAHLPLAHVNYADFLHIARLNLKPEFWEKRERMRRVYEGLGGNPRGLEFFAAATLEMDLKEEDTFLAALAQTQADLQANMAIRRIYERLPEHAQTLLARLRAYHEFVPVEGVLKLALDMPEPEAVLGRLQAVSLLEVRYEPHWQVTEYSLPPLVADWMGEAQVNDPIPAWLNIAADFHLYLHRYERRTLAQAVTAQHALRRAGRQPEADRLTLDWIVGPLTLKGFYLTLLTDWLPQTCRSTDRKTQAEALGQTGKILLHLGNFEEAMPYLKQSLAIMQQIGDKAGEGATLNNISQIYDAQGDYATALDYLKQSLAICQQIGDKAGMCVTLFNMGHMFAREEKIQDAVQAWVTVYKLAKEINEYSALKALSELAPQLGLPEGLEGWEMLANRNKEEEAAGEGDRNAE